MTIGGMTKQRLGEQSACLQPSGLGISFRRINETQPRVFLCSSYSSTILDWSAWTVSWPDLLEHHLTGLAYCCTLMAFADKS